MFRILLLQFKCHPFRPSENSHSQTERICQAERIFRNINPVIPAQAGIQNADFLKPIK